MTNDFGLLLAFIGVGLAIGVSNYASARGVGAAANKGTGVLAEKPEMFTEVLKYSAMPGSQGIYGLLVSIIILSKIGVFTGTIEPITISQGAMLLGAGIGSAFANLSAIFQGEVAAGAISAVARNGKVSGLTITLVGLVETFAIFGLLVSILLANFAIS